MSKYAAYFLIFLGIAIFLTVFYINSKYSQKTRSFSPYTLLSSSWEKYKDKYINKDGRVIDYSIGDVTTSEGQSYALLRAVWLGDKETFDKVWLWTRNTTQNRDNNLFNWNWGKKPDKSYGTLPNGGENSASDADSDIALALILASHRWNTKSYLDEAKKILTGLWEYETDEVMGKRYLIAGNWAKGQNEVVINLSYFAPYAWRIFSEIDPDHDWKSLISPAYELLNKSGKDPLNNQKAVGLPPDWLSIDRTTGKIQKPSDNKLNTNYSYDAMRIPFRIALDYQWNRSQDALAYLKSLKVLEEYYTKNNKLVASYSHSGKPISNIESPAMYATSLGYFLIMRPELAKKIYEEKIVNLYINDTNSFNDNLYYYEQNMLWFGSALYNNRLVSY